MAETGDVSTTVSVSNRDSLCCCDTFCLTNKCSCKGERRTGAAFVASLAIHNMEGCASSRILWLFAADSRRCSLVCLSNADAMCFYEVTPQIPIRSKKMRWAGQVARMEDKRGAKRVLMGKPKRMKLLLRRPGRSWENNIKTDL